MGRKENGEKGDMRKKEKIGNVRILEGKECGKEGNGEKSYFRLFQIFPVAFSGLFQVIPEAFPGHSSLFQLIPGFTASQFSGFCFYAK